MTSSRDFPNERVLINTLQFTPTDIAVLDVRPDFTTVNWTTNRSQIDFFRRALQVAQFRYETISLHYRNEDYEEIDPSTFERMAVSPDFNENCDLVRIDLTRSRSFAWQRLSADSPDIAGIGDSSADMVAEKQPTTSLLEVTASEGVQIPIIMSELDRLLLTVPGIFPPNF